MRLQIKSISLLVLLLFCSAFAFAQTPEEIRKEADELFDSGLYIDAFNLYNKISGVYNRDHDWNFRYGASLLFASHDKVKAIDRLAYSVTNPSIDKRAYYFLGRAYHLNYQFKEAQQYYEKFRDQASSGQLKDFDVNAQLNACKYGRKLLTNITDLIVMEKREIGEGSFYDLYDMSNIGGTILVTDEFGTKFDKKQGHRSVIHFPKNSPNVFYSSYGDDGSTGLDIYQKKKLPDGSYSLPQKVRGVINTDLDEDYAYMHPNGQYLYFCSKGHNSMGGYDVFRSPYDYKKDSFGPPENLDFAISSPDDDIMYVVDSLDRIAFFASRRESQDGKLFVYEVRVERIPMQIAAIKGKFENTIVPSNKEVNIEIEDFSSGSQIGSFNSKSANGDYFISFPKGGKYKYFVTVKGSDVTHYAVVEVPTLKELRPLKQKISLLRDESGEQYVKIENLFDERFEDPVTVMAQIYQELSKLNPNAESFDLDSLNAMKATDDVFVNNGLDAFSTKDDVVKVLENEITDLKEDLAEDEENSNIAFNLAQDKSNQANEKMIELNKKLDQANSETDPVEKKKLFEEAYNLNKDVKKLNEDAQNLVELGNDLGQSADAKKIQIDKGEKALEEIKTVTDGDKKLLADAVNENSEFFAENVKDRSIKPNLLEEIVSVGNENTKEANSINGELIALRNDKVGLEKDKSILEDKLKNTNKKKDKEAIEEQILAVGSELNTINDQINSKEKKHEELIHADTGPGKLVSVATEVADDKYDNSSYANELTNDQKAEISKNVKDNDLSENLAIVDKTLEDNNAGNRVDLFASDEQRSNYSLEQWNDDIDKEIKNLRDDLNTTPIDRQGPILQEIEDYENLKKSKQNEYTIVQDDPKDVSASVNSNEIIDGFDDKKKQINEITDEEDRTKANLKLNQELKDEITNEKKKLNELIAANPDADNLKDRLKNLQEIEDELDNEINKDQNWIRENSDDIKDPKEILADMDSDYQSKVNQIYEIADENERNNKIRELNESVITSTNERIQELDAILENDSDNQEAKDERKRLIEFKEEVEKDLSKPILAPVTFDPDNIQVKVQEDDILPDYTEKLNEINAMDDERIKKGAENDLNKELSGDIRNQIKQLNDLADENPGNKDIKKRIDNLKKLDDDLNKKIVENENWLRDNPDQGGSKDLAEVKDINPDYENKMNEINDIDNSKDRTKAIKELNEETIAAIDTRVNIIDDALKNDPNNPDFKTLSDEKDELNNLKNQIKNNIEDPLVDGSENLSIEVSPSVDDILPNYQSRLSDIDQSDDSDLEKEQAKVSLNNELIVKIDEEIDQLTDLKNDKPELSDDIEKRIEALKTIKSVKEDDIKQGQKKIEELKNSVDNGSSELTDKDLEENVSVEDVFPSYQDDLAAINSNSSSELEKENSKMALNQRLLNKVENEIDRLNNLKSENPDKADQIEKRIESFQNLKSETIGKIDSNKAKIQDLNKSDGTTDSNLSDKDTNPNVSIEDIYPGYENEISSIETSTTDVPERENAKINVNKNALQKIDTEIERLNNLKSEHPDVADKIEKRISNIRKIRTNIENEISKSEKLIEDAGGTVEVSNIDPQDLNEIVLVEDIYPEYEDELAQINNNGADNVQIEKDKIALNKRLINKVDAEIDRLNDLKTSNPDKADQIEKRITGMRNIKRAKENEITSSEQLVAKAGASIDLDTTDVNPLNINETATIAQVFPNYANELDNINIALQDDETKEKNKIDLNKQLISKVEKEINDLENVKSSNPESADKIEKRISSLSSIKNQALADIQKSEDRIATSSGSNRPDITIGSLMPNYESDMSSIQSNTGLPEKEKLEGENELNETLVRKIDNKISDLQEEWEENDELGEIITEEIDKLEELKELKRNEISENNDKINALGATDVSDSNTKSVGELKTDDFSTEEAKNVMADNAGNLSEIEKLQAEIEDLENQLANTENDKDKKKIQDQIDKRKLKLAKVENEVITDLASANDAEYQAEKEDVQIDQIIASANNPEDEEVLEANRKLKQAEVLMVEADALRDEASKEKDPVKANEILTEALDKENEAKNLTEQANRVFKTARVVDNFNKNQEKVIVEVPENVDDRESTKMLKEAENLDIQANGLTDRASELRDSANTVKKKYKEAILVEADALDKKAEDLRVEANDIRTDAGAIKEQEDEIVAVQINKSSATPDSEVTNEIATSDDYKEFYEANKSANENIKKANDIEDQIEEIKTGQRRKIKEAVVSYQDGGSVDKVIAEDKEVQADQAKIDSLRALQKSLKDEAVEDLKKANDVLDRAGDKVKDDMIALVDNNVDPKEKTLLLQDSLAADYEAPTVLASDIFRKTDDAIYGDDKQIPMDQKTSGLVYKVQVGAFRQPLPQDYFKEFAPVSGQKLGNGVTRYMAGYFTKEGTANDARGQIRGIGYGDAFVVAYCNGERISIQEAREIEAGRVICEGTVTDENFTNNGGTNNNDGTNNTTDNNTTDNNTTDNNTTDNNTTDNNGTNNTTDNNTTDNNGGTIQPNNSEEENAVSYYTNFPGAAKANQVEIIKGLFFTVQIGVYTKPVRPAVLFNIQPLNSQKLPNGNIRYSTGMYTSVEAATVRKNETVQTGVQDAFVTAYFNGERITIQEANELLAFGDDVLYNSGANKAANFTSTDSDGGTTSTDTTNTDTTSIDTADVDTTDVDTTNVDTTETKAGLMSDQADGDNGPPYRINLGYFNGRVPVGFTDLLLNNQNEGILSVSDIDDNVLYFVGTYESKAGAEERMTELKSKGFNDAEVVSLKKKEIVEDKVEYFPEGVYYRVLMGRYKEEIPGEYATILLQTEDLLETDEDVEGTTYLMSTKLKSLEDIEDRLREFAELGFEEMEIVSYYQYDAIPLLQAEKITNGEPIGKLTKYEHHEGVDADPYLYNKEAIYFHVEVGRFYKEIPSDFTALLFENSDENILREETFDEELIFFSENTYSYEEAEKIKADLIEKGFVNAEIKAFHKYDPIGLDKAKKVLGIQ